MEIIYLDYEQRIANSVLCGKAISLFAQVAS